MQCEYDGDESGFAPGSIKETGSLVRTTQEQRIKETTYRKEWVELPI